MKGALCWPLCVLAALCCLSAEAAGILKLSRTEMTLAPGKPAGELWAENVGDSPLYLDVTQQLVANPGQTPERLVPVGDVPQPGLLVTPDRLALAPGQKYRLSLKELHELSETQVWRVTFRPRERIIVDAGQTEGAPMPLIVSVGYGVAIYQLTSAER
ncbi:hypothetical protein [Burkholderia diffusa]|uniref:hypothetical protein n=1 Tax=Burkholderia diffusa TaxID=488732 RepID=UPI000758B805|nr:hypothetical protein [Burkholderia diffusa]KVN02996.1 hypothetical protein WJ62_11640 [Burkholderia diffusa]